MLKVSKLQVRHKSAVVYYEPLIQGRKHPNLRRLLNMRHQRSKAYQGTLSAGAKKRINRAVDLMAQSTPNKWVYNPVTQRNMLHRISFITLTVACPRIIEAREAHDNLLAPFLQWLRRTMNVTTYIWKAELQERGQIHYHLTTPTFIHYKLIRYKWNQLQRMHGYLDEYVQEHGHGDPNSTDIHKVIHPDKWGEYMAKELCKSVQNNAAISGKTWDCSMNLKENGFFNTLVNDWTDAAVQVAIDNDLCKVIKSEYFAIIQFYEPCAKFILSDLQYEDYCNHIEKIRSYKTGDS